MITAWKQDRVARSATGDPGSCDLRKVANAIFYRNGTGYQWPRRCRGASGDWPST
ncbi:hypothetical protein ACFCWB_32140 [Streptomyces bacillaris]|uniref:hypothetical protein n=1 Tax=Streptomyces bacillaris TaxID=68179 RepID=UPI0035D6B814